MASIVERVQKSGAITYQVKWRQSGKWQTENFGDTDSAEQFRDLVEGHRGRWPYGWVRGQGFVEAPAVPGDMPFVDWAYQYIADLTGIEERTRDDYESEVRLHLSLIQHKTQQGQVVPATICNITAGDVRNWVRVEQAGERDPGDPTKWLRRRARAKSIGNRHGLLFSIVQAAVDATPQLRTTNCCKGTRLPRVDSGIEEDMTFLERDEYLRIVQEMHDPGARDLADWLVGTGMRWGEASALQVRDLHLSATTPTASVQRAWKRAAKGSPAPYVLGPPKSRKSRRRVALSPAQVQLARRLVAGKGPQDFVFLTAGGTHWRQSTFWWHWRRAVQAAVKKGLPKAPRVHDLRHTHVSWLIAAKIPLPAIQARLGHESITTTVDRYGHLVRELDAEIAAAVEAAMAAPLVGGGLRRVV